MPFYKIDLHVHTEYSDSSSSIEDVLDAARKKGLDGVAITDHDNVYSGICASKLASDLLILPGVEVTTKDGHLLLFGIKNSPPKDLDAIVVSNYARREGGIIIVPHPNIPFISFREEIIEEIRPDAIETFNAKIPFSCIIDKNVKLAERLGLPQTGGSDAHTNTTIGDMYTVVEAEERTLDAVLDAIRKGRVRPAGKTSSWMEKARMAWSAVIPRLNFWQRY
ncbi:PHP domain-containing protein [Candidatus Bathyarchaeota archaeon]|nr:PHP domain-containing protein [Candidatus Bathyarchaeota archaeon]